MADGERNLGEREMRSEESGLVNKDKRHNLRQAQEKTEKSVKRLPRLKRHEPVCT